jgi:hypothetical protein
VDCRVKPGNDDKKKDRFSQVDALIKSGHDDESREAAGLGRRTA